VDPRIVLFNFVSALNSRAGFLDGLVRDKRNRVFVSFIGFLLVLMPTSVYYLFGSFSYIHGVLHTLTIVYFMGETFASILHLTSHGRLFKEDWMEYILPVVLVPLMGQTWCTYYHHHVKHHHVEANGENDLSSTKGYQRDSFVDFLQYFLRFYLLGWIELPIYFWKRGRWGFGFKVLFGELGTIAAWTLAGRSLGWRPAIFCFFLPVTILRFGMMAANWGQHAFVAAHKAKDEMKVSPYTYSLTIQDSYYNTIAFNDGYHATHHVNGTSHWSLHPTNFAKHVDSGKYVSGTNAVIISGEVNFGDVWQMLMFGQWDKIADMYLSTQQGMEDKMDRGALIQRFKELMKPM